MDDVVRRMLPYAPVLQDMVEALGSGSGGTTGEALSAALRKRGMREDDIPEDVRNAVLKAAFRITGSGRLPGCPDS